MEAFRSFLHRVVDVLWPSSSLTPGPPGAYQQAPYEEVSVIVPITPAVTSNTVFIGNAAELGLLVPTLTTATTVQVKVGNQSDGSDARAIVDQGGTTKLVLASGSGNVAISSNDMALALGYPYLTVVIGAAQAAAKTFTLTKKAVAVTR